MNTRNISYPIFLLLVISLALSACRVVIKEADDNQETGEVIGLANPAALYCEGLGYRYESVERDGGMDADCVFPDGQRCGQWDFLAGRCGQEMTYCELQGGAIQEFGNMGICLFSDGSSCGEFQLFSGECSQGDNLPQDAEEEAEVEEEEIQDDEVEDDEGEVIEIKDFIAARDYLAAYLAEAYGMESQEPWMETDITIPNPEAVRTFRYVSGPVTIVLSAGAAAPYVPLYTVQEASDRGNGFYWTGTVAFDGTIIENEVVLPWTILNTEDARDAALGYLSANYNISSPVEWIDEGNAPTGADKISWQYSAGSWLVVIEFVPAAPMVSSYTVAVEDSSTGLRWEGEISGQGEIVQISFVR